MQCFVLLGFVMAGGIMVVAAPAGAAVAAAQLSPRTTEELLKVGRMHSQSLQGACGNDDRLVIRAGCGWCLLIAGTRWSGIDQCQWHRCIRNVEWVTCGTIWFV